MTGTDGSCPRGVDLRQAAAFPVAYGTSHIALVHRAKIKKGQTLLVLGAAGGGGGSGVRSVGVRSTRSIYHHQVDARVTVLR